MTDTKRLSPERIAEYARMAKYFHGQELTELLSHIDAIEAELLLSRETRHVLARELAEAKAEIARLSDALNLIGPTK